MVYNGQQIKMKKMFLMVVSFAMFAFFSISVNAQQECRRCGGEGKIVEHCKYCDGNGEKYCSTCGGDGVRNCGYCFGSGSVRCGHCRGRGTVNNDTEYCPKCNGDRNVDCENCYGKGTVACPNSNCRNGVETCRLCNGTGLHEWGCPNCRGTGRER